MENKGYLIVNKNKDGAIDTILCVCSGSSRCYRFSIHEMSEDRMKFKVKQPFNNIISARPKIYKRKKSAEEWLKTLNADGIGKGWTVIDFDEWMRAEIALEK